MALLSEFWNYFSENKGAVAGLAVFVTVCLIAVFADVVAPYQPQEQYRDAFLKPPFWQEGADPRFILGTDAVGRDILSRLIYGSRYSLFIGVIVVTISMLLGVTIGLLTGFFRGAFDNAVMRVMDVFLSFPSLLLALVMVALLGPSLTNAMIAIALIQQPHYVRLTRAAVMSEMGKDYVTAARVAGVGNIQADAGDHFAELHGAACSCRPRFRSQARSSTPRPSASWAWAPSRQPRNGAPCWPMPANTSPAPGGL